MTTTSIVFTITEFPCVFLFLSALNQVIRAELEVQQYRLEHNRLLGANLRRSLTMSPVVSYISVTAGELSMPISLATSADHVAQKLNLVNQSIGVLAEIAERQRNTLQICNGAILSAEKQIDDAKQVMGN